MTLNPEFSFLNANYHVPNPSAIEDQTKEQSGSALWFDVRRTRLTSSRFSEVLKRKSLPNDKFLNRLFSTNQISAPSLDYGRHNEKRAKEKYLKSFQSRHIHACGFVVNNEFSFLGASPDGKVCDNGQTGIIEIKCPYTARAMTISEAVMSINDFCLTNDENNKHILKLDHPYYIQVQGQLMVTGCTFCDFVVYTSKDIFVQRITPDIHFMSNLLEKLASFFKEYALPFLQAM